MLRLLQWVLLLIATPAVAPALTLLAAPPPATTTTTIASGLQGSVVSGRRFRGVRLKVWA